MELDRDSQTPDSTPDSEASSSSASEDSISLESRLPKEYFDAFFINRQLKVPGKSEKDVGFCRLCVSLFLCLSER